MLKVKGKSAGRYQDNQDGFSGEQPLKANGWSGGVSCSYKQNCSYWLEEL